LSSGLFVCLDSRLRGNDKWDWIPAYAGMTAVARMTRTKMEEVNYGINLRANEVPDMVFKARVANALQSGKGLYPIHRRVRFAARVELEALFDAIALDPAWRAERIHASYMVLDAEGLFVSGWGSRKADYSSCTFNVWARDVATAEAARERILGKAAATRITEPMFTINWHFMAGSDVDSAEIEEIADGELLDEAYPEIPGGVRSFIQRYLDAKEAVLVLQGPPGTGKTRLIRAILGEISRRKEGEEAQVLYTGDMKALESDNIFVKFITGWDDAFVVEDADHLLKPRSDGNQHLHRFLTIADGVVRSQGRKIIFSTNLPNVGDLDEALIRPGRCFARAYVRNLTAEEAAKLAVRVAAGDPEKLQRVARAFPLDSRSHSVASVFREMA
jgi:ATPase family protein associated with various cellular activities (AAA)